ncbi:hypothetical protein RhiirA1_501901 [Rhizophagus irregularis]|uniref:Uncharacterized protein n=1 Tax=Rhizophagus irregularis TaxID=588596 RepID=A0A2N0S3X3_9GLOM|nr:hypothetical protein RhiirA1_501901 [Rhizophagus irregularis]
MPRKRNSNTTTTIPKRGKKKEVFPETVTDNTELAINEILKDGNNQQSKSTSTKRGCNKKETVASCNLDKSDQLVPVKISDISRHPIYRKNLAKPDLYKIYEKSEISRYHVIFRSKF